MKALREGAARRAVAATRYPPEGMRGVSVSQRSNRYGTVANYFQEANQHMCVVVQIESRAGVAAIAEIAVDVAAWERVEKIQVGIPNGRCHDAVGTNAKFRSGARIRCAVGFDASRLPVERDIRWAKG